MDEPIPDSLQAWWEPSLCCLHSADSMADGWTLWRDWHKVIAPENGVEIAALEADRGEYLGYVRMIARRRDEVKLEDGITTVATRYVQKPLLR